MTKVPGLKRVDAGDEQAIVTPAGCNSPGLAVLPILDLSGLKALCAGDPAMLRRMLRLFVEIMTADLQALAAAVSARETTATARLAHRIKGAARSVGSPPIGDIAQNIETAAQSADWTMIEAALPRLVTACDTVGKDIAAVVAG